MAELNKECIEKVFSDEAFVKSLFELEEPADVQAMLKEKGIEMSLEEIKQLGALITKAIEAKQNGEELSLEQLDEVAGGGVVSGVVFLVVFGAISVYAIGGGISGFFGGKRW